MFLARKTKDGREQTLFDHLRRVANAAGRWSGAVGFSNTAQLTGQTHDMGKLSRAFQTYLDERDNHQRGSVIHSTQGAKLIYENTGKSTRALAVLGEVIANCVAGHHGALSDGVSPDGATPLSDRLSQTNEGPLYYSEVLSAYQGLYPTPDISQRLDDCAEELEAFLHRCQEQERDAIFMVNLLTKFLFSCLVDADRYDAYCFATGIPFDIEPSIPLWGNLLGKLEKHLDDINSRIKQKHSPIHQIRRSISQSCLNAAKRPKGIYQLEVPTGGGKTFSSLRFALAHAKEHGMQRIIYIIPYLSVLDQSAEEIRAALGIAEHSEIILEHHSDLVPADDEKSAEQQRLLTSRWDAPIVLTTMVQFMESVFSAKSGKLRKFHNMANAVLIFDEVQSLPVKCVHLFNQTVNFLSAFCGSTAILCTATQPLLEEVKTPIRPLHDLIPSVEAEFLKLGRTRIVDRTIRSGYSDEALADFVLEKQAANNSCLVVLNTKANVARLYETVRNRLKGRADAPKLYHLTTLMCPAHRLKNIENIKRALSATDIDGHPKRLESVICISTQLIEAGVEVSFGCVIRAIAGLDSVAQSAGRCNRHGEDPNGREVYLVNLADENLTKLPDIQCGAEVTRRILGEDYSNLLSSEAMRRYYDEYFYKRQDQMNYSIGENGTIYDLLSYNKKGCGTLRNRSGKTPPALPHAFQTAGEAFCLIEKNTTDVLVPYGKGLELAENYQRASLAEKPKLLRRMGRYTVSLYAYQVQKLEQAHALRPLADGVLLLDEQYYHEDKGVVLEAEMEFLCR